MEPNKKQFNEVQLFFSGARGFANAHQISMTQSRCISGQIISLVPWTMTLNNEILYMLHQLICSEETIFVSLFFKKFSQKGFLRGRGVKDWKHNFQSNFGVI